MQAQGLYNHAKVNTDIQVLIACLQPLIFF